MRSQSEKSFKTVIILSNREDSLIIEAIKVVAMYNRVCPTILQRRLQIGYMRAVRLLDRLTALGVLSEIHKSPFRDVLIRAFIVIRNHVIEADEIEYTYSRRRAPTLSLFDTLSSDELDILSFILSNIPTSGLQATLPIALVQPMLADPISNDISRIVQYLIYDANKVGRTKLIETYKH